METMATMGKIPRFQYTYCHKDASFVLELAAGNLKLTVDYEITNITR